MTSSIQSDISVVENVDPKDTALYASKICAGYGELPVLHDIDLFVRPGEIVTLLGPNGAGKTTTMLALAGGLKLSSGEVRIGGEPAASSLHKRARKGLSYVPDTKGVFARLTVRDNIKLGLVPVNEVMKNAPEIATRGSARAGLLSGGEQQLLAVARGIARKPKVLMIDEMSLGLAPKVVSRLVGLLRQAADDGVGVLIVEQHTKVALEAADRAYIISRGQIVHTGPTADLLARPEILEKFYLAQRD
jgi:branched-chain amino acid transport system ATP-binding protein